MGYTHYWYRESKIDPTIFQSIVADFKQVVAMVKRTRIDDEPVMLRGGLGKGAPIIASDNVCFNGDGELAHETFEFPQIFNPVFPQSSTSRPELFFEFCKTAQKPYDLAVTCFLIIAKHYLKDKLVVHSDGDILQWADSMSMCQEALGYGADFSLTEED